jgi:hypothetical protein
MRIVVTPVDPSHAVITRDRVPVALWCDSKHRMFPCEANSRAWWSCVDCENVPKLGPNLPFEDQYPLLPAKGDRLFVSGLATPHRAIDSIIWGDSDSFHYEDGYLAATQHLIDNLDRLDSQDHLVYPIVFLSRHYLELVLKSLLVRAAAMVEMPLSERQLHDLNNHRLDTLWTHLEPMMPKVYELLERTEVVDPAIGNEQAEAISPSEIHGAIGDYIRQLCDRDPLSMAYRYARTKGWKPSLTPEERCIDLDHFAEHIMRLIGYFHWLRRAIDDFEDLMSQSEIGMP